MIRGTLFCCCAATAVSPPAGAVFVDATAEAGLDYVQYHVTNPPLESEPEYMSGGAAAGDFDGDGWTDLYVTRLDAPDLLFRNRGDGTFEDVAGEAGLDLPLRSNGAGWADIDDDGDLDLYVTSLDPPEGRFHLFVNDGSGHFTEEAVLRGAAIEEADTHWGYSVAFGDYDLDGWIDLHTTEWRSYSAGPSAARLLRNRGAEAPGHFEDVTVAAGVVLDRPHPTEPGVSRIYAFASRLTDVDHDGHPDLLVASDFGTSRLFWNNGDGSFVEGTGTAGIGSDENGMGSAVGDFDGDGRLDWFVTSIYDPFDTCGQGGSCQWGATGNRLYRNEGDRTFSDATDAAGVRNGHWGWGAAFLDYDNDGDLDLAMTNGVDFSFVQQPEAQVFAQFVDDPMRLWRNDGSGHMTEVAGESGVTDTRCGKGLLTFDYDRDGDLDLFVAHNAAGPVLYRNDRDDGAGWLRVEARGAPPDRQGHTNRDGVGVRVTVVQAGRPPQVREISGGSHFLGQSERAAHFGLGPGASPVELVKVEWPASGRVQFFADVPRNGTLVARDPAPGSTRCGRLGPEAALPLIAWLPLRRRARSEARGRRRRRSEACGRRRGPAVALLVLALGLAGPARAEFPLHEAVERGDLEAVQALLEAGADPDARRPPAKPRTRATSPGETPLLVAAAGGRIDVARALLAAGADPDAAREQGLNPLLVAAHEGHLDFVALLLEAGADPMARLKNSWLATHRAAQRGNTAVVALLLDHGLDVDAHKNDGATALHLAAQGGHVATAKLLLDRGASVDSRMRQRATPLHRATQFGHPAFVELLVERGADVNAVEEGGMTPFLIAAAYGHPDLVRFYLERGADVNAANSRRWTALHLAARLDYAEVTAVLLENGADPAPPNDKGQTAYQVAMGRESTRVAQLLRHPPVSSVAPAGP